MTNVSTQTETISKEVPLFTHAGVQSEIPSSMLTSLQSLQGIFKGGSIS